MTRLRSAALLLLLAAWWAYAAFAASLGLWFSLRCRTTLRATVWTLLGSIEAELKARVPEVELVEAVG